MKSNLAKVSLALLSTVFLLGCQEQGSEPVGPEGPEFDKPVNGEHRHGDDVDPDPITLTLADGMVTTELPVTVSQDSNKKLKVDNGDFVHAIQMNFMDPGVCVGIKATNGSVAPNDEEIAALRAELHDFAFWGAPPHAPGKHGPGRLVTSGFFTMQIDKTDLTLGGSTTDDDHLLLVEFEGTLGPTRIQLGSPFDKQVPPNTVKWVSENVFEFTGPVVVWASGGGVKDGRIIWCAGGVTDPNKVVATLNP